MPRAQRLYRMTGDETDVGQLDSFMSNTGPLNVTIKTAPCPSPDKTPSTLSWSPSPSSVMSSIHGQGEDIPMNSNAGRGRQRGKNSMLRVQVESTNQKTTFYVPVALMLQREMEMQESSQVTGIDPERWSASRLYTMWCDSNERGEEEVTIRLKPESAMGEYSELKWRPWLSTCIRTYYNTGTVHIPDDCVGSDILLALEYFGILTSSPETFVFDSSAAFDRIKAWSSYFILRNMIAEWIVAQYEAREGSSCLWVTSENRRDLDRGETLLELYDEIASVLEGGLQPAAAGGRSSCQVVHSFFSENESESKLSREMPSMMRRDFSCHLQRQLAHMNVSVGFQVERVKITRANGRTATELRAVLRVQGGKPNSSSNTKFHRQESRNGSTSSKDPSTSSLRADRKNQSSDYPKESSNGGEVADQPWVETKLAPSDQTRDRPEIESSLQDISEPIGNPMSTNPYGDESDLNNVEGVFNGPSARPPWGASRAWNICKGQCNENTAADEDQRHPKRSSPSPDGVRSSPEDAPKPTTDAVVDDPVNNSIADANGGPSNMYPAPIGYINTAFGDLQSVTSALSGPNMDESVMNGYLNKPALEAARMLAMKKGVPVEPSPASPEQGTAEPVQLYSSPLAVGSKPVGASGSNQGVQTARPSSGGECGYWEGFLAGVCDAIVPTSSQNNRATSPVRSVTITPPEFGKPDPPALDDVTQESTITGDIPMRRKHFQPQGANVLFEDDETGTDLDLFAKAEEVIRSASIEGKATTTWIQEQLSGSGEKATIDRYSGIPMSKDSSVMSAAKSIGENLSYQFDEFLKVALESNETPSEAGQQSKDGSEDRPIQPRPRQSLAQSKRIKGKTLDDWSSQNSSAMQSNPSPMRSSSPRRHEVRRKTDSDVVARKIKSQSIRGLPSRPPSFPKAFATDVQLPPREPRRARVREKVSIARRKGSARCVPPNEDSSDVVLAPRATRAKSSRAGR